jgi:hypothetical protein
MKPVVVLVGGYLGAGKTTLLLKAADLLERRGLRTALVMNDQGEDLVDTSLAARAGREVRDVTGACFCCDFSSLLAALRSLEGADVILAEPVGSCTDIVRTVVHPLQQMGEAWSVAPFTVLVDPTREASMPADSDLAYLFGMQMAEADLLVASKSDLGLGCRVPAAAAVSAKTGDGVSDWLELVLNSNAPVGSKPIAVDYQRYGAAEASLAWLNWSATLTCRAPVPALQVLGPFLDDIRGELLQQRCEITHLKALDGGPEDYLRVSFCGNDEAPSLEGAVIGDPRREHRLLLNLRAGCAPECADAALQYAVHRLAGDANLEITRHQCFRPSMPFPSIDRGLRS